MRVDSTRVVHTYGLAGSCFCFSCTVLACGPPSPNEPPYINNVSSYCVDRTPPLPLVRHHHDRQVLVLVVVVVVPSLTRNAAVEIEVSPWVFRAPSTFALTAVCTRSRCFSVYLIPSRVHSCLHVSLCSPWLLCTIVSCPSVGGWWVVAGAVGRNDGNSGFVPLATCDLFASLHAPMMSITSVRRGR